MIWFDPDPKKTFAKKLSEGITHYRSKYALEPISCLINSAAYAALVQEQNLPQDTAQLIVDGLTVQGRRDVLKYDLYISNNGTQ